MDRLREAKSLKVFCRTHDLVYVVPGAGAEISSNGFQIGGAPPHSIRHTARGISSFLFLLRLWHLLRAEPRSGSGPS